ncbi:MAG: PHB depolymerase family esterase, partial [Bdellovibrionales bacterium]|nr:PHB depolymerase family esterase [Bdellovibrionales bacterium]
MKTIVGALLFVLACSIGQAAGAADAPNSETTTKGGWLREKIKKRILKRVEEKPAPEAKTNIQDPISMPGTYTFTFQHEERTRYYKLHIPKSYSPAKAHALIVAMHGGGGDMEIQATDEYYGFLSASEREGFIVLFPNGYSKYKSGKIATWNAGKCCAWSRDEKVNDVDFIRQAVGHVKAQVKIDSNKIFATGMSNGAMLAYRLACEASDLFRKIAAVAGTDNTLTCQPQKPVSVLHIHSLKDEH